jgi:hypothetical protein
VRELPADLAEVLRQLEETAAEARTMAIRAKAEPLPQVQLPDATAVEEAATRPDAPAELKAVAGAVEDGRVTWEDVAAGRGAEVPEVRAAYEANQRMIMAALFSEPEPASAPPDDPDDGAGAVYEDF